MSASFGHGGSPPAYCFRPAARSSHSSACERAIRAASRARPAARRSCAASSFRFACSYLSACASASAALCSSVTAVRLSTDASCAARTRVSPTTRSAAAPGGSTASESIAPTIMASVFRLARSGVRTGISHSTLTLPGDEARRARTAGRAPACRSRNAGARRSRGQRSMTARFVSWWRSPVAGVRSSSRAICSALSSRQSAALIRLRARRQQSASRRGREPAQG